EAWTSWRLEFYLFMSAIAVVLPRQRIFCSGTPSAVARQLLLQQDLLSRELSQ
ncbi:hypothetical protein HAX54_023003, partial [Datura stramonium]|nr:hypothetical protein [Datura stramonium]